MFNGIYNLAKRFNIKFSLFVDDMVFSSINPLPKKFISQVMNIISKYDLKVHPKKIQFYNDNQHKKITGVIITKDQQIRSSNSLQQDMYKNFLALKKFPLEPLRKEQYEDDARKLILVLKGQIHAIRYVEVYRVFPHIHKVIKQYENVYM